MAYQEEGANLVNPDHELFVINNTMVNDLGHGTFVDVDRKVSVSAVIKNNRITSPAPTSGTSAGTYPLTVTGTSAKNHS